MSTEGSEEQLMHWVDSLEEANIIPDYQEAFYNLLIKNLPTPSQRAAASAALAKRDRKATDAIIYAKDWPPDSTIQPQEKAHYANLIDLMKDPVRKGRAYEALQKNNRDKVEKLLKSSRLPLSPSSRPLPPR